MLGCCSKSDCIWFKFHKIGMPIVLLFSIILNYPTWVSGILKLENWLLEEMFPGLYLNSEFSSIFFFFFWFTITNYNIWANEIKKIYPHPPTTNMLQPLTHLPLEPNLQQQRFFKLNQAPISLANVQMRKNIDR